MRIEIILCILVIMTVIFIMASIMGTSLFIYRKKSVQPPDNKPDKIVDFINPTPLTGDVRFYNNLIINGVKKDIIVVLVNGRFDDYNNWTNIPITDPKNPTLKNIPSSMEQYFKLRYGEYRDITFPKEGVASLSYRIRVNCDDNMNCELGDSSIVPGLDPPGKLITKPPLDTKIEFSPGCILVEDDPMSADNPTLCSFNPSIIQSKATDKPYALTWFNNGNKIGNDGLPANKEFPYEASIGKTTFFDISAVDGYTVPVSVYIKRPPNADYDKVKCTVNNGKIRLDRDDVTMLMDCSNLDSSKGCPVENINPDPIKWRSDDPYNPTKIDQPAMNYDRTLLTDIPLNAPLDLTYRRDSTNIIGCAQPCTAFTHTEAINNNPYIKDKKNPPLSYTSGVNQLCVAGSGVSSDGSKKSSKWNNGERGYYIRNFSPEIDKNNVYYDPSNGSAYVNKIDDGKCRAYAWSYNDELKNIAFDVADKSNIIKLPDGTRVYQRFKILVIIGVT